MSAGLTTCLNLLLHGKCDMHNPDNLAALLTGAKQLHCLSFSKEGTITHTPKKAIVVIPITSTATVRYLALTTTAPLYQLRGTDNRSQLSQSPIAVQTAALYGISKGSSQVSFVEHEGQLICGQLDQQTQPCTFHIPLRASQVEL